MEEKLKQLQALINEWESLDKEGFIMELVETYLTEEQLDEVLKRQLGN